MPEKTVLITKASGEKAPFSPTKLRHSLERAGAGSAVIDRIVSEIEAQLVEGMSTKKIYSQAFSMLRKHSKPVCRQWRNKL